jgi:hypothetical protein
MDVTRTTPGCCIIVPVFVLEEEDEVAAPRMHCTENPIYEFPEIKFSGLTPNSYIHVSVSDLYISRI